ncbi:MAG: GAF domain-containing protein, partial [Chloroflexi bacterium]|nr:GAF domain-containing protein [Chloroflexota bacterium]
MKKLSISHDLGLQLTIFYIIFVGLVVAVTLFFARTTRQRLEDDVKAANLALARSIAQETDITMRNALQAVRELGEYTSVIEADPDEMEELFDTVMKVRPDINLIYRLNAQGFMIFHYPIAPISTVGDDFSFRDYFQRAALTTRSIVSQGRISPTTNQPVVTTVMPLWGSRGNFLGVVATNIKLESLSQTLGKIANEYSPEENFLVMIIDSTGQIIAHPVSNQILKKVPESQSNVTEAVLLGRVDNLISLDENGEEILYSFVPVSSAGWGVIVGRPTKTAFATPRAFFRDVLLALIVFLTVGLFFWLGLVRQAIRPLRNLADYSQTIGREGDITTEQRETLDNLSNRTDQVGYLTRSLTRMEAAIEARLNELATLLQTSASVLSTLDSQTVLNRILEQVERLLAVEMSAIVALDERRGIFRAQASRGLSKRHTEQLTIDPNEPHSVTLRAIRSGEAIQISDTETNPSYTAFRPRARVEGYRSILAIPLNTQYAPPSALLIFLPNPHTFTPREIALLSNFANHAAMAIENAVLYTRSDTRLQEQTRRLEALVQSMHDGLLLENLEGQVVYANRRISELTDLPLSRIIGSQANDLFELILENAVEPESIREAIQTAVHSHGQHSAEISLTTREGMLYLRLQVFDVTDTRGVPIGRGQILHDVTADRKLDRMKSSLISTVSHELRTPLASIKGYASTLLAEDVEWDSHSQREFLNIISDETDHLSNLVNDLLDLSRIEAGSLTVSRTECDLNELV